jgi:hypothetical protein
VARPQDTFSERVTVVVEPSAFERANSGNILGPIRLHREVTDGALAEFPEHGWTDFVVVILGWWLGGLRDLGQGAEQVSFMFMDGPLAFRVTAEDPETYRIQCLERRVGGEAEQGNWTSPKAHFEASVLGAGVATLAECDRRGWRSRDIDTLRNAIRSIRVRVAV